MTTHGVIPIMEMMEVTQEGVLLTILKVVNRIVSGHPRFLQSLCMLGLIPAVYRMVHWRHPMKIRVEAGKFVKQVRERFVPVLELNMVQTGDSPLFCRRNMFEELF